MEIMVIVTVLVVLGVIGKTQTAIDRHYAHKHDRESAAYMRTQREAAELDIEYKRLRNQAERKKQQLPPSSSGSGPR